MWLLLLLACAHGAELDDRKEFIEGPPPARRSDGTDNEAYRMYGSQGRVNYGKPNCVESSPPVPPLIPSTLN